MFSLSLVACHNYSRTTFHVNVGSLPSVSELLEGMGEYLEAKYGVVFQTPEMGSRMFLNKIEKVVLRAFKFSPPKSYVHL